MREARTKGVPSLGAGAIYPVPEDAIVCDVFSIPDYFPQCYALDVGWNRTAAIWGAHDTQTDIVYLYSEHYRGDAEPPVHAAAIRARGTWIPGVIDPAARGRGQKDGKRLLDDYIALGLETLVPADNALEAGIYAVWTRLSTGRLKVFRTLTNWLAEFRFYQRDEKGRVKDGQADHLMDACLVGDTLVVTDRGALPIRALVGRSGRVLTRGGAWATFCGARKTILDADVVRLEFDNGDTVICTRDHPFLTPSGWVAAEKMLGQACFDGARQRQQWSQLLAKPFRNIVATATIFAESISSVMASVFIGAFGQIFTAQFQTASTYTTPTRISATISQKTWFSCLGQTTCPSTIRVSVSRSQYRPSKRPRHGILRRKGWLGITPTMLKWATNCTKSESLPAITAATNSRQSQPATIGSAPMPVKRDGASRAASTMSNGLAWFAAQALWLIATSRQPLARANAVVNCLRVSDAGKADVYCLTVPGPSAFAVASGLIVHNTRYLILSGLDRAIVRPASMWRVPGQGTRNFESSYDPLA
jgi:hypothetical protein